MGMSETAAWKWKRISAAGFVKGTIREEGTVVFAPGIAARAEITRWPNSPQLDGAINADGPEGGAYGDDQGRNQEALRRRVERRAEKAARGLWSFPRQSRAKDLRQAAERKS